MALPSTSSTRERLPSYPEFIELLQSGRLGGVFLFAAEEPFLAEKALEKVRSVVVDPGLREFNYTLFYADECDQTEVCAEAEQVPFGADRRLVVVRHAEQFDYSQQKSALAKYAQHPAEFTCLILVGEKFDSKTSFYKHLAGKAHVFLFQKLRAPEAARWVTDELTQRGKRISPRLAQDVVSFVGTDLGSLENELEILVSFMGQDVQVKPEHLGSLSSRWRQAESVFALADAVANRDSSRALGLLRDFNQEGKRPEEMIGIMDWQIRRLYQSKLLLQKGTKPDSVAQQMRIYSSFKTKFFQLVNGLNFVQLGRLLRLLGETESQLRSGGRDQELTMELLVIKMCSAPQDTSAQRRK